MAKPKPVPRTSSMHHFHHRLQGSWLTGVLLLAAFLFLIAPATDAGATGHAAIGPSPAAPGQVQSPLPLRVRGDHNYPPYEFINAQGQPDGFNVDIIHAVAKAMGLAVAIDLGPWDEVMTQLEQGRIDALIGMFNTPERDKRFDFSIPHFIASYAVFVRKGSPIRSFDEARDKRIIVQQSDLGHDFIRENNITTTIILKTNWEEVLTSLAQGEGDCAIVSRLQGTRLIGRLPIAGIHTVGPPIIQRKYCLAVADGNSALLAQLNEGLSIIREAGIYDEIYNKWFGAHEERPPGLGSAARALIWVILPLALLALGGFAWSALLNRQINRRTEALRNELAERRRAEQALQESEERNRLLSDLTMEGILLHRGGVALDMNTSLARMIGAPREELLNRDFLAFIHPDDQAMVGENIVKEYAPPYTIRLARMNGAYFFAEIESRNFPRQSETWRVSAVRDVTRRVQAEEALRESEATFRNIVQASPMGIHLYQLQDDGRLIFIGANPAADQLLGTENNRFVGMTIEEAFPPLRDTEIPERYRRAAEAGESWHTEQVEYDHNDIAGAFEVHVFQMAPGKAAVLFNDITERKRSEQEQEKLRDQLVQALKIESIGRLAGGVAHDFNNMLGVILGQTEMALETLDPTLPLHASLCQIRGAALRSADLTRQLLAFARRQTVAPRQLDLNGTLEGMLTMLRRLIGENVELAWLPGRALAPVNMDPSQLDQILMNLCINARDAIDGTGRITIETASAAFDDAYCAAHIGYTPGEYVLLAVSDNGRGMDAETLSHLFEPFFTTKETGKGTGLGLATVYGIVRQNNGFINVYSEPGRGSTFKMYLPRQTARPERPVSVEAVEPVPRGEETVLVVEDEPMILDLTTAMLELQGYTVLRAARPDEAILLARDHAGRIDLLMTDVIMPGMNGRELSARLSPLHPEMRQLFMSGYTANVIAHHGVLDENVHFIQKPFSLKQLAAKVREALAGGRTIRSG